MRKNDISHRAFAHIFMLSTVLTMAACGHKAKAPESLGDSVVTQSVAGNRAAVMEIKVPGDPTGDADRDGRAVAEYIYALLPRLDTLDKKLEAHNDLLGNDEYNKMVGEAMDRLWSNPGGGVDYDELAGLLKTDYPTGDLKRDAESFVVLQGKADDFKADFGQITDKYDAYYTKKGNRALKKFYQAVRRHLPEGFEPDLYRGNSSDE